LEGGYIDGPTIPFHTPPDMGSAVICVQINAHAHTLSFGERYLRKPRHKPSHQPIKMVKRRKWKSDTQKEVKAFDAPDGFPDRDRRNKPKDESRKTGKTKFLYNTSILN
jgi:hypothetical protein